MQQTLPGHGPCGRSRARARALPCACLLLLLLGAIGYPGGARGALPAFDPVPAQTNDPDTWPTVVPFTYAGSAADVVAWRATASDARIADVEIDAAAKVVRVWPKALGRVVVRLTAQDAESETSVDFAFTVRVAESTRTIPADRPGEQALELENRSDESVPLFLDVNDRLYPGAIGDIVAKIAAMPDATPNERFEHKAWRALSTDTWRGWTMTSRVWPHDPAVLLNSLGFAYCDDVAAALALLVRAAGGQARVWTLGGHVVPEVWHDDHWSVLDADTGAIYYDESGRAAGVADLAARPELVTAPPGSEQIAKLGGATPFVQEIADIYSTQGDNALLDVNEGGVGFSLMRVELPPRATFTLGGRWTEMLRDPQRDEDIAVRAEARLSIPAPWVGALPGALVLVDARGSGRLDIEGEEFEIGSEELAARLADLDRTQRWKSVVRADGPLELTFLYSAVAARLQPMNEVVMRGIATGAVDARIVALPAAARLVAP